MATSLIKRPQNIAKTRSTHLKQLAKIFKSPKSPAEMQCFLEDFLTPSEAKQLYERWLIGSMLMQGYPQREIKQTLGVSISKVSRGSYVLQHGCGGFAKVWRAVNRLRNR